MSNKVRAVAGKWLPAICCLAAILVAFLNQQANADDAKAPSAEEKKAVAVLAEKGSVIFIDGEYQVTQILGGRNLTNDDLQHLRVFKKLKTLSLSNSKIDDSAVGILKALSQLQALNLPSGSISEKAHEELKKALPNCRIVLPDRRGGEVHGGKPFDVKEVSALDVAVALLVAAREAGGLDGDRGSRGGRVVAVQDERAREVAEAAADRGDHRVLGGEAEGAVGWVDDPSPGGRGEARGRIDRHGVPFS